MSKIKQIIKNKMPIVKLSIDKHREKKGRKVKEEDYPLYLKKWYKKFTGEELDLDNPKNYTQKIQWLKLNETTQEKANLSDKYKVREWIKEKIGEEYLIPLIGGPYYSAEEINFDSLPKKFVIKTNHGSGWNIIVKDKSKLKIKQTKHILNEWLKLDFSKKSGLELQYSLIKPCLIIEKYMENIDGDLQDYKFLCFNGKAYYCWVDVGRFKEHKRNVYDMNWNLQEWNQEKYGNTEEPLNRPKNFKKMVELCNILAKGFKHVRVDFYNINGQIYFGEMTFTNGSGRELIYPAEKNVELGNLIDISK